MSESSTFARWVKGLRAGSGLTQRELAYKAGCSLGMVRRVESGDRRPSRAVAQRLAEALQLPPADLATFLRLARMGDAAGAGPLPPERQGPRHAVPAHSRPQQLPGAAPLLGRERELAAASQLLLDQSTRLLSLLGPGGVGKTRLAIQLATDLAPHFLDGSVFVALGSLSDPSLLLPTVAQSLRLKQPAGEPVLRMLATYLQGKDLLLVLDNLEHLSAAAGDIAALLEASPRLKVLATTQAALYISCERLFELDPLAVPNLGRSQAPEELMRSPAVALFVARAQKRSPGLKLHADNLRDIAELCVRLDGLPLAIELAAANTHLLSPRTMLERFSGAAPDLGLDLQAGPALELPARQQTIRRTVDWSYQLLEPQDQALLRRLAVFSGGWTLEAAEELMRHAEGAPIDAVLGLQLLIDRSLVRRTSDEPRFEMLEVVREYARGQLALAREEQAFRERHAQIYLALVEAAEPALTTRDQLVWLERLEQEQHNLRAAADWLLRQGDAGAALRFVAAIWKFWQFRHHWSEGRRLIAAALRLADAQPEGLAELRARALWAAGWLANDEGDHDAGRRAFEQSLALAEQAGDDRVAGRALQGLGLIAENEHDLERARALYRESLARFCKLQDTEEIAWSLYHLASVALARGSIEAAEPLLEEALALFRGVGHRWGIAWVLSKFGLAAGRLGQVERAESFFAECEQLFAELGDLERVVWTLHQLGELTLQAGQVERARAWFEESLELVEHLADQRALAWSLHHVGRSALRAGAHREAQQHLERGLGYFRAVGDPHGVAWTLVYLACSRRDLGDLELAQLYLGEAVATYESLRDPMRVDEVRRVWATA